VTTSVSVVERAVAAIRGGEVIVLPTDTVYGLAATAFTPEGRDALYRLKGRDERQPTALVAASLAVLLECVPELRGRAERQAAALLPGPYTLVLANPARRFAWLCGENPETIGVRVPALTGAGAGVLAAVGAVAATSANLPGGRDPRTTAEVPPTLRRGVAAVVDGGVLPGAASTVVDLTGPAPKILRAGAGDVESGLARLAEVV
jgi:L-threonylcarbamoyladenylate synthase